MAEVQSTQTLCKERKSNSESSDKQAIEDKQELCKQSLGQDMDWSQDSYKDIEVDVSPLQTELYHYETPDGDTVQWCFTARPGYTPSTGDVPTISTPRFEIKGGHTTFGGSPHNDKSYAKIHPGLEQDKQSGVQRRTPSRGRLSDLPLYRDNYRRPVFKFNP